MNFEDAHKAVDALLTQEGKLHGKSGGRLTRDERLSIEKVLEKALDNDATRCVHCNAEIVENVVGWVDVGTRWLCFCTDQDETHDGVRHSPT